MEEFAAYIDAYDRTMTEGGSYAIRGKTYTVRSLLRDSAVSRVFLVEDLTGAPYVLKIARDYRRQSLRMEYELLSGLQDRCFPQVVALEERDDHTCLLRDYVPGKTLAAHAEEQKLTPSKVVRWTLQVCDIIAGLHRQVPPIIHRDIKPQNFIVTPENRLALIDLDSCQRSNPAKTVDTQLLGTAGTAAPEQFGAGRSDSRTDVYGIGMLMLYLFTNDVNLDALRTCGAPRWLRRVIRRCTHFDPAHRYPTLKNLRRDLRRGPYRMRRVILLLAVLTLISAAALHGKQEADRRAADLARSDAQQVFINVPLIEQEVSSQLSMPSTAFTRANLREVHALLICGDTLYDDWGEAECQGHDQTLLTPQWPGSRTVQRGSIRYLDDLRSMPNLQQAALYAQRIADIGALEGLPLTHLALADNPIRDFSVLSSLKDLVFIDLSATDFSDVSVLAACPKLQAVRIIDTPVKELSPLVGLPIRELYVGYDNIGRSATALDGFPGLIRLKVTGIPAEALPSVGRQTALELLDLPQYPGLTLEPLQALTSLRRLFAQNGDLQSLRGAEELTALQALVINGTAVTDLSPLFDLPDLEDLSIGRSSITDFEQLLKIHSLKRLFVDSEQQQELFRLHAYGWPFEIDVMDF